MSTFLWLVFGAVVIYMFVIPAIRGWIRGAQGFSAPPTAQLTQLSQRLFLERFQPVHEQLVSFEDRKAAERELIIYCSSLPEIAVLMQRYGVSQEDMTKIFEGVCRDGGYGWFGRHLVAASALAYPETFECLLLYGINQDTIYALILHFENTRPIWRSLSRLQKQ